MKSKEEMIETMIIAFENAIENACEGADECYDMMQGHLTEIGMNAALKALCGALPEPLTTSRGGKIIRSIDKADELYGQLKQWGK